MSVFYNNALIGASGQAAGGYEIQRSLRFNLADSSFLSRTPASAGNRKTWTWAGWVKRSGLGSAKGLFSAGSNNSVLMFNSDVLQYYEYNGSVETTLLTTTQVFRDPSAWYHIVLALDTAQATASNRFKIYVNGTQITTFTTATYPAQNYDTYANSAIQHYIGYAAFSTRYFDGYLAECIFVDGQALTPTSFGEFDTNNVWQPKAYSGSYGTNGFKLDFADNSAATAAALGADSSGNGNNWTPNNLSVTAGAGNDSLVDVPTNGTEVDTGAGGEVRGNYATLNPLKNPGFTLSNGNLDAVGTAGGYTHATMALPLSGKYYWEITNVTPTGAGGVTYWAWHGIGYHTNDSFNPGATVYATSGANPGVYLNGSLATSHTTWANGDIIGYAYDADASTLRVYRNGTQLGTTLTLTAASISNQYIFKVENNFTGLTHTVNFGQRQWVYQAPAGFKALCTANLPTPTITKPSTVMDVVTYTGTSTGSTSQTITGLSFSPDLVWIKNRTNGGAFHVLNDTNRGANKRLSTNSTAAEEQNSLYGYLSAFTSNGFTLTPGASGPDLVCQNGVPYVAWTFDAGSSTVTNTSGTISSQVRANPSAGFSVITYTGNGVLNATVGHGLGVAPKFIIVKSRSAAEPWVVLTTAINGSQDYGILNSTAAFADDIVSATPTSTVFSISNGSAVNGNTSTYVAYCFAPIAGYSSFGTYTGNGSADGPFVFCNFRPRWIMIKRTDAWHWNIYDSSRPGYNQDNALLYANLEAAESTGIFFDIVSNGFKLRNANIALNNSGSTFIYAAFAESPFALARAR